MALTGIIAAGGKQGVQAERPHPAAGAWALQLWMAESNPRQGRGKAQGQLGVQLESGHRFHRSEGRPAGRQQVSVALRHDLCDHRRANGCARQETLKHTTSGFDITAAAHAS